MFNSKRKEDNEIDSINNHKLNRQVTKYSE